MYGPPTHTMTLQSWTPLSFALRDYHAGNRQASVIAHIDDGSKDHLPAAHFFRDEREMPPVEAAALALCRGRVLDAGAGAGAHAAVLQDRGLEVLAIDIAPINVEIMRARGIREAHVGDIQTYIGAGFDSLLLMMNGIGVVGDLDGLDRFLGRARDLLNPHGQILLDSSDLRRSKDITERRGMEQRKREGRYFGEVRFTMEYQGQIGSTFNWLFLDPDTLGNHALAAGWETQLIFEESTGEYAARLWRGGR